MSGGQLCELSIVTLWLQRSKHSSACRLWDIKPPDCHATSDDTKRSNALSTTAHDLFPRDGSSKLLYMIGDRVAYVLATVPAGSHL